MDMLEISNLVSCLFFWNKRRRGWLLWLVGRRRARKVRLVHIRLLVLQDDVAEGREGQLGGELLLLDQVPSFE